MKRSRFWPALALIGVLAFLATLPASAATPAYFRQPDVHGDRIVFCAEGDLWTAPSSGGVARRLTAHPGAEYFPAISPDGARIAFTGEYDGNRDVFVLPIDGGEPRRLTWRSAPDEVVGWMPDGQRVLFRSPAESPTGSDEIYVVPVEGGDPEKLPLGWAVRLSVDPKTGLFAFNRKSWERATWKRYRGGTAPDIWVGDPAKADFRKVTDFEGINAFPMWHDGRIYFASDQGGTMNLWSMRPDGSDRKRHTNFEGWDARWPSNGPDGRIAFVLGADLHLFDPKDGSVRKVEVTLPSDRVLTRVRYPDAKETLTWFDLSPDGTRLAIVSRGEIFSVPVREGVTLPVSGGTGARESWASFDGEGKKLVYVTDASREEEIRIADSWGRGEPTTVVPAGASGWHFPPKFSPDGKWIAYADQRQALMVVPAGGGSPVQVDRSEQREIREYEWSADGRWLAYSKTLPNQFSSICLYDTKDGKVHEVTGKATHDYSPAWDPSGRYLYFLSDRATNPILGGRDWTNVEAKNTKLYAVLLRKEVKNPVAALEGLPPEEEEKEAESGSKAGKSGKGASKESGKAEKEGKAQDEKKAPEPVEIDLEGLAERFVELPIPVGLYAGLAATGKHVFYFSLPLEGFAEGPDLFEDRGPRATLMAYDLEKKETKPFVEGVSTFALARKSDKIAVMKAKGDLYVVDAGAPPGPEIAKGKVSLQDVVIELDPREEWAQIYYEGWRHLRDFYWDPGMGNVDWKAVRDRYAALLPRLANREDLRDLMGEVIGELGTSHTYAWGGDPGVAVSRVPVGLLGADLEREGEAYRVVKIYRGDPADLARSPLDEPQARVREGEFILAVNHRPFREALPFDAWMDGLAGKSVVLTVNSKPSREGAREVLVKPLRSDEDLRYVDWVRRNREFVAERTGGKIGYVHIPNMWKEGLIRFNTWFYPQLDLEGMIVDVRWNGGGSVSQMIVERLRRKIVSFDRARGGGVSTYPSAVLNGPFVVLTNEFAGSDGDIFPTAVQIEGLAPVIGMRSWGGVVGIRGDKLLQDGGMLTQPEFAWWDAKQGWSLENRGVLPDIEVQNLPQDVARGADSQLDRGIREVLRLRDERPAVRPEFGPVRDRSRKAFESEVR